MDESLLTRSRRLLDFLAFQWSSLVVSFDTQNREAMTKKFVEWLARIAESRDGPKSFNAMLTDLFWGPEMIPLWQRIFYWLLLVLIAAFFVLLLRVMWILYLMFKEYLSGSWRGRTAAVRRPEARFYDRLSMLLAHKGHVKPAHLTPHEFAVSLSRSSDDLSPLPEFVDWFYATQYGERTLGREQQERIQLFLQKLREDASFGAA